jgi:hypothetical protein
MYERVQTAKLFAPYAGLAKAARPQLRSSYPQGAASQAVLSGVLLLRGNAHEDFAQDRLTASSLERTMLG